MHGDLEAGSFLRLAHHLGLARSDGELVVESAPAVDLLVLRRGFVLAAKDELGTPRRTEGVLERLAETREGRFTLEPPAPHPAYPALPVALDAWARGHIERGFDLGRARALTTTLAGVRLSLRKDMAPAPADEVERCVLLALCRPRGLEEIERVAGVPRFRLLGFVHLLRVVGALELHVEAVTATAAAGMRYPAAPRVPPGREPAWKQRR